MLIVGCCRGMFFLKPDSALGRLFMWKITCQAIAKLIRGDVIRDSLLLMVRRRKLIFCLREIMPTWEERVAGSPEYAFNEYLEFDSDTGYLLSV